jgi:nonsense-mediated mRNA decay protein 3
MVRSIEGKHALYFEAILQLRDVSSEVEDFVYEGIQDAAIPVAKEVKVKNGVDLFLADVRFTKALGKKLQDKFGGQILSSASLFGRKDGKEIYRTTILFRGVPFHKGDLVFWQGEEYNVKAVGGDLLLQHAKTGKKVHINWKDVGKIRTPQNSF